MFNVGGGEVLVILLIALIVLGPDKLPNAARQAGKYLGDFRRMSSGFQRELRDAMDLNDLTGGLTGTPNAKPTSPGGPTAQPAAASVVTPGADATPVADAPPAGDRSAAVTADAEATSTPTAPASAPANGASVRKRSIEVDGPSASFD